MSIKLKGSTDGSVTLQAPADTSPTGTDTTLILPTTVGSANQFLKNGSTAGTLEFSDSLDRIKRTYSSEVSYSTGDSEIEFTGIPANFSKLRLIMRGFSCSGTNNLKVQIGHAANGGTYLDTDYKSFGCTLGTSSNNGGNSLTSFVIRMGANETIVDGFIEIYPNRATSPTRLLSNYMMVNIGGSSSRIGTGVSPDISSVTIDRIRIIPSGTNTFDNGANAAVSLVTEVIE